MNKKIIIFIIGAVWWQAGLVHAGDPLVAQDENYFLQEEAAKTRAQLLEKDAVIGRMTLEQASLKAALETGQGERDTLQGRVSVLQKSLLARDQDEPRKLEQAAAPFRSRMDELTRDVQVLKLTIDQKNAKIDELGKVRLSLQAEMDRVNGEKLVLREELRKVADQLDGLRTISENKASDERSGFQAKIQDLQSRLSAEQMLTGEKIKQSEKPLQDKIAALEPCQGLLKDKEGQLAALMKEKGDLSVKLRAAESKNVELTSQNNDLRKSIQLLKENPFKPSGVK